MMSIEWFDGGGGGGRPYLGDRALKNGERIRIKWPNHETSVHKVVVAFEGENRCGGQNTYHSYVRVQYKGKMVLANVEGLESERVEGIGSMI